jgi:hypothetical protein
MRNEYIFVNDEVQQALMEYRQEAKRVEDNAGYSGMMTDGGSLRMMEKADAYEAGLKGEIPEFLKPFIKKIRCEKDPEYVKYLELKQRFED